MADLWPSFAASTQYFDSYVISNGYNNNNRSNESFYEHEFDEDLSVPLFVDYPTPLLHFASACCIIFMMVGIPGNLITIAALARCKKVRNATAVFIMNLSLSDLLFCCFNLPLGASTFWARSWLHGRLLCRLFPLLRYGLLAVSIFTVLAITINRYVMIGHPTIYPKLYRQRYLGVMVSSTWACGFGALVPTWLEAWGRFGLDRRIGSCSILPDRRGRSPKEFLFVVAFVLPCLAIVVCYARIFYIVRKTALQSRGHKYNTKKPISSTFQSNAADSAASLDTSLHMKPISKLNNKNNYLSPEDSALGSVSTATTTADKSLSFSTEKSSPKTDKSDHLYSSSDSTKENGIEEINGNNNKTQKKRSMLNFKKDKNDSNLLSPRVLPFKCTYNVEKRSRKMIMEPSSSSGIDMYDDQENTSVRSNTPTSVDSSPTNPTARRKSRASRFASIASLTRITSLVRKEGRKCVKRRPGNTSNGSNGYPGKMSTKDKKLLKMILVIFVSFLVCYLPITLTKICHDIDIRVLNIVAYILIYLTTCINPIIYVVMSSEYRQAYKNLIMCKGFVADAPRRP